jgi:hypothetical protein
MRGPVYAPAQYAFTTSLSKSATARFGIVLRSWFAISTTCCCPSRSPLGEGVVEGVEGDPQGRGPSHHASVIVDIDEAPDGDIGPVVPPPSAPVTTRRSSRLPQSL